MALLLGVLSLAAFTVMARQSAGQGGAGAPPPQPLTPGPTQIVGKVVEAGTTTAIPGAIVTLDGPSLGSLNSVFSNGIPGGWRALQADAQGQFAFRDVPAGSYTIRTTAAGYVNGAYGQARPIAIRGPLDLDRRLDVTGADRIVPVQIQMSKLAGIGGRVFDERGEPLVGANVTVLARMTDWGGPVMQLHRTVPTDDRGAYHVDVTPGDYVVGVQMATSTAPISTIEGFQQATAEGTQALQRYLDQVQAAGAFLARGVGVRVGNFSVMLRNNVLTGLPPLVMLDGRPWLYPSAYHPSSTSPASAVAVTLQSGEEKTSVDIRMQLIPARRVSGRITGPDGPGAGLAVLLVPADPAVMRTTPASMFDTPQALADGAGNFVLFGVAPGAYLLRIVRPESSATAPLLWALEDVIVGADADVDGLQISLKGALRVSGRINVEGSGAKPPTSQQLRGINVLARPVAGSPGAILGGSFGTRVDHPTDTQFISGPAVPGSHMITVSNVPPGYVLKSVTAGGQNIVDKAFDLSASGLTDIVVTITDQISTVSGTVRDASGTASDAAIVVVYPADRSLWKLPSLASRRVQTTLPGRDGRFTFRGLPAGDYIVAAVDWSGADLSDPRVLTAIMADGSRVTIADGDSRTQDLRVMVKR